MKRFIVDTIIETVQEEDDSVSQNIKPAIVPPGITYGIEYSDDKKKAIISIDDSKFLEYPDLYEQLKDNELNRDNIEIEAKNICSQFDIDALDRKAEIQVDKYGIQKNFHCMCVRLAQNIGGFFYIIDLVRSRD